jgi:hypothetical protein
MANRWLVMFSLLLGSTPISCVSAQDCSGDSRDVGGGQTFDLGSELVWESSPPAGPFVPFGGGDTVHFHHPLHAEPFETHIEVSFNEYPENGEGATDAAGDEALKLLTSADEFVVHNRTCSPLFIRVIVHARK